MNFSVDKNGYMFVHIHGTKGFLNPSDVHQLTEHAKKLSENSLYAETGSFMGASAMICAMNSKAKLWCHDIWTLDEDIKDVGYPSENFFTFNKVIRTNDVVSRVFAVPGDSLKTYRIHDDNSLDLVFIDGDHSYEGALGDFKNFFPKVKNGGVILAHDCTPGSECLKALKEFCESQNIEYEILPNTTGMAKITKGGSE
jgi:predicted O-methyltransferase YrrM